MATRRRQTFADRRWCKRCGRQVYVRVLDPVPRLLVPQASNLAAHGDLCPLRIYRVSCSSSQTLIASAILRMRRPSSRTIIADHACGIQVGGSPRLQRARHPPASHVCGQERDPGADVGRHPALQDVRDVVFARGIGNEPTQIDRVLFMLASCSDESGQHGMPRTSTR
jgi:hypothetical protein